MLLGVNTRLTGGVAVLDLIGRATAGAEADSLRDHMMAAFKNSSRYILLNCEELAFVDSSAIGEMVFAYTSIVRGGGMVKLLRPHKRVRQVLEITHLEKVFEILEDEGRAVASFSAASAARSRQALDSLLTDS